MTDDFEASSVNTPSRNRLTLPPPLSSPMNTEFSQHPSKTVHSSPRASSRLAGSQTDAKAHSANGNPIPLAHPAFSLWKWPSKLSVRRHEETKVRAIVLLHPFVRDLSWLSFVHLPVVPAVPFFYFSVHILVCKERICGKGGWSLI